MKRPIFLTAVLICFSLVAYKYLGFYFFLCIIALMGAVCCLNLEKLSHIIISIFIFSLLIISVFGVNTKTENSIKYSGENYTLSLIAVSDETVSENSKHITVKTDRNNGILSDTKFNLYYYGIDLYSGQKITAKVYFFRFHKEKNYSLYNGEYGNLWLVDTPSFNGQDRFYYYTGKIRGYISKTFSDVLPKNCFSTVISVLLGDKSQLQKGFYENVKRAGVSHIMAVSGLHLTVILGFIFFILGKFIKNRYLKFFASGFFIFFIAALCGFTPSILRAGLMFLIFAFAPLVKRDTDVLSVISFAAIIILIASPMALFNASFQMSVLAIISIIYVMPFYCDKLFAVMPESKMLKAFVTLIMASVFANIFTMPVAIYNFKSFSAVSVITNIFISAPTTFLIQLSLALLILAFFPVVSDVLILLIKYITMYINSVVNYFGSLKYAAFNVPSYFCIFPLIAILLLVFFKIFSERRAKPDGNTR
ncbi:MAG: ComEC/Rec2 family competence protein [Clostridia bacterium]|nr:ComEC/Rec2 family competence protein [Clostridia bacterium]